MQGKRFKYLAGLFLWALLQFGSAYAVDRELPIALLRARQFPELDRITNRLLDAYKDNTNEEDSAVLFIGAFGVRDPNIGHLFDEWIEAFPRSAGAYTARARYRYELAWGVRGQSWIAEVPKERIASMEDWIAKMVSDLARARDHSPKQPIFSQLLIKAHMTAGTHQAAQAELRKAIELDPEVRWARYSYMQTLYPEWGGSERKMEAFLSETQNSRKSSKMAKTSAHLAAMIQLHRAKMSARDNDYQEAAALAKKAVSADKDHTSLTALGRYLIRLGRYDEAITVLSEAIELEPDLANLSEGPREQRGYAYQKANRLREAFDDNLICAKAENAYAQYFVGYAYAYGRGVEVNRVEAVKWLSLAVRNGEDRAKQVLQHLRPMESNESRYGSAQ